MSLQVFQSLVRSTSNFEKLQRNIANVAFRKAASSSSLKAMTKLKGKWKKKKRKNPRLFVSKTQFSLIRSGRRIFVIFHIIFFFFFHIRLNLEKMDLNNGRRILINGTTSWRARARNVEGLQWFWSKFDVPIIFADIDKIYCCISTYVCVSVREHRLSTTISINSS